MKFKVGDVVTLNSGGPRMTVSAVKDDKITAIWPDESGYGKIEVPSVCISKVTEQPTA
jgi:uncharacterized protein YodC (DUF2158 family)